MPENKMPMMPKKEALKSLIKTMREMQLEKIKGYSKGEDEIPAMVAEMKKKKDNDED